MTAEVQRHLQKGTDLFERQKLHVNVMIERFNNSDIPVSACCCCWLGSAVPRLASSKITTFPDKRETHTDHYMRQTSSVPSSTWLLHRTNQRDEENRFSHTHTHTHLIHPSDHSWPLGAAYRYVTKIISFVSWLQFFGTLTSSTLWGRVVRNLVAKQRHVESCKLSHPPHSCSTPFLFCLQLDGRTAMLLSHPLFDPFHTSPLLLLSPPVFSFFPWQAALTLAVVGCFQAILNERLKCKCSPLSVFFSIPVPHRIISPQSSSPTSVHICWGIE